jgi:hypothetical protein
MNDRSEQNDDGRSEHDRRDRQMIELLNELRIALPGVQILFAFLLTVPFSQGWQRVTEFQKDVFFATLIMTALSTTFLIAPSAAHRLRFHKRDRTWVIESANRMTIAGLVFLSFAMTGAFLLITDYLFDGTRVWVYTGLMLLVLTTVWFARPLARRESSGPY